MNGESPVRAASGSRTIAVILFIAAWMACGWLFRLDANLYLVLGVPLTVLFQRFVRRGPLRALWVRDAPPFRPGWKGALIGGALSVVPLADLSGSVAAREPIGCLYDLCSVAGAIGAAYALRHLRRGHLRLLAGCLLITLILDAIQWASVLGLGLVELRPVAGGVPTRLAVAAVSFLQYMAVVFAMEEVTFRMLDSHLHEADAGRGVLSAIVISAAWGLWHLPIVGEWTWPVAGLLVCVHVPYGVCLSLFWRKSGNLVIPGLCHALGDAIRNGLTFGG